MEKTGVVIGRDSWLLLRDEPLYSARFIDRDGTDELALVVRVEELEWFVESGLPLAVSLCTWRSSRGVWLAAVAYQLSPSFGEARAGVFFLNPRRAEDVALLDKLPRQERLAAIFLSADCETHYTITLPQDDELRAGWRERVARIIQVGPDTSPSDEPDPAFEDALDEFQAQYSPQDILLGELS